MKSISNITHKRMLNVMKKEWEVMLQVIGFLVFTTSMLLLISAIIYILDLFILRIAVRLFDRESILVEWK